MAVPQMNVLMQAPLSSLASPAPDPEVAATAKRRPFSSHEQRRILAATDRCTEVDEIGALLRREGLDSSQLATWRKQRAATERAGLEPQKCGRNADPTLAEARRVAALTKEHERLRRKLAIAQTILDVQKNSAPYSGCPRPRIRRRHPNERPHRIGARHRTGRRVPRVAYQPGRNLSRPRPAPAPAQPAAATHTPASRAACIERARAAGPARGAVDLPPK